MVNLICPVMSVRCPSSPMAPGQEPLPQPVWEGDVMSTQSPLRTNGRVGPSGCLDGFSSTWGSRTSLRRGPPCLWDAHLSLSHDAVCSLEAKVAATSQSERVQPLLECRCKKTILWPGQALWNPGQFQVKDVTYVTGHEIHESLCTLTPCWLS